MSNFSDYISSSGGGGKTMVTATGVAAQDLVVGDKVKLTGTGEFIKDPEAGDRYYINKRYIHDGDNDPKTPYNWPSSTYSRAEHQAPMAITLSSGHTMVYGHGYISNNSAGTLKFFTLKNYELDEHRFHVVDTQNVSSAYTPELLYFYEIGDDSANIYVMCQWYNRNTNWPYYKMGFEVFFAVEKTSGNIVRHMTTNSSGYPGNSLHPYTQLVEKLDSYVRGDMAGDIACYGMQNADRNYNSNNQSTYGYAFRKLNPAATHISAGNSFSTPQQILDWDSKAGVIAVDQADRVFIAWHKEYQQTNMKVKVVKFDSSGSMTVVADWYTLFASGTSTTLNATNAHNGTFIKGADGTVALINCKTTSQYEVQKFVWNGTALVESGTVYTIDVDQKAGSDLVLSVNNMSGQVAYTRNQYQNNSFYWGEGGNFCEIDLVNDTATAYYVGYFGSNSTFPTGFHRFGAKYVTLQFVNYSSSAPYVSAATYAQLKNDVTTQEKVGVVTTAASTGNTATIQLDSGITSEGALPSSKYVIKNSMAYPLAVRQAEDMPKPPLFHVPKTLTTTFSQLLQGVHNNVTFNAANGYGTQWAVNTTRNNTSAYTTLCSVTGMGNIILSVGSTNTSHSNVSIGFKITIDGIVVWDNLNSGITYNNMNSTGAYLTMTQNFNNSFEVTMRCTTTDWNFSFAKQLTMY